MPTWSQIARTATYDPGLLALAAIVGGLYLWGARRAGRPGRPWPLRRTLAFSVGMTLLLAVLQGPLGGFDSTFFWVHMVQHLTLMMIVAPLLLLGSPVLLALQATPAPARRRWLVPVLRSRSVRRLTSPLLTWLVFAAVVVGVHVTPFYSYALTHPWCHDYVEHPLYLIAALLYFYPLIGGNPVPHRPRPLLKVVSLLAMMLPESMTGFYLYSAKHVLYQPYELVLRPYGPDALADQQLGGGLMWSSGMLVGAFWVCVAVANWLRDDAKATVRVDRQIAREQARSATEPQRTEPRRADSR